jgi:hypothetical protein
MPASALATIDNITVSRELPAPALQRRQAHAQKQNQPSRQEQHRELVSGSPALGVVSHQVRHRSSSTSRC